MDAEQAPNLPTVSLLATMAAIMASQEESSYDTAKRAFGLWESCDGLIQSTRIVRQYGKGNRSDNYENESRFLKACGLKPPRGLTRDLTPTGEGFVPLGKFLNACKPSPNSKAEDMKASWRAFRRTTLEISNKNEGFPLKSEKELESAVGEQMESNRLHGISIESLFSLWRKFLLFREWASKEEKSARGKKGGRPKNSDGKSPQTEKTA